MDRRGEGLVVFSAILLGIVGIMRIFDAIWAFRYHGVLPAKLEGAVFGNSLKTYGWIDLIVAAVLIVGAVLVINRSQVGRWIGIVAAAIGCISAVWFMPYYPVWSLAYIGLCALVIYTLVAYVGKEETVSAEAAAMR